MKLSDTDLVDIRARYEGGADVRSIARAYGCSWNAVQGHLDKMGIYRPVKRKRFTDAERRDIVRRYKRLETPAAIGRDYQTNGEVITKVLRAAGIFEQGRYQGKLVNARQMKRMTERYNAGVSIYTLARDYKCSPNGVWKLLVRNGVKMRFHGSIEGRRSQQGKYIRIQVDESDPFAVAMGWANGFLLEHRLVMAHKIGRPLEPDETVHHIDGNPHNNDPANLQLRNGRHGRGVKLECLECGSDNIGRVPI